LSLLGVSATYLFFHWALDFASVIQVATLVTTIPIFVGLANLAVNHPHS
jgi:drug/metabolite transporter (DMT)-like permease